MKPISKCKNCGAAIKTPTAPSAIKRGAGKYCSGKCRGEWQKKNSGATRDCVVCGKSFYAKGNPSDVKSCSRECGAKSRMTGRQIECANCGVLAYQPKSQLQKSKISFCCLQCANEYQGRLKVVRICQQCGKHFKRSASQARLYCSDKCRLADKEHLLRISMIGNLAQYKKRGLNKLETEGGSILRTIGLKFNEQVNVSNKFVVDVMLSDYRIVIQWDGEYWHSRPDRKKLDKSQDAYLAKCGYRVLRFTDKQVWKDRENVMICIREAIEAADGVG